jgi:hypothetical protein
MRINNRPTLQQKDLVCPSLDPHVNQNQANPFIHNLLIFWKWDTSREFPFCKVLQVRFVADERRNQIIATLRGTYRV